MTSSPRSRGGDNAAASITRSGEYERTALWSRTRDVGSNQVVASFVSRHHLAALAGQRKHSAKARRGAVLFIDVSGFTALTEAFSAQGHVGAERLSAVVSHVFGIIIGRASELGGDVVAFAGDAVWILWEAADDATSEADAVGLATQCALDIQRAIFAEAQSGLTIRIRASVACGEIHLLPLDDGSGRVELIVTGSAFRIAGLGGRRARADEVLVCPDSTRLLSNRMRGMTGYDGWTKIAALTKIAPLPRGETSYEIDGILAARVKALLPAFIAERLESGLSEWLAEFRTISVVFVGLGDREIANEDEAGRVRRAVAMLHAHVARYDGEVYQALADEKGLSVVFAFGLPVTAHEDDATRAVRAALDVRRSLLSQGISPAIGVATGSVFCSVCGNDARRSATLTGSALNLAARLMQASAGDILCDANTMEAASGQSSLGFERGPALSIAGKSEAVAVFRPMAAPPASTRGRQMLDAMAGRTREQATLATAIRELRETEGKVVLLEGEAGIGKSHLVRELLAGLNRNEVRSFVGAGSSLDSGVQYHALEPVFRELFELDGLDELELKRKRCIERLIPSGHDALAPLLDAVLPLDFTDNESTAHLTEEARAERTRELLIACLESVGAPMVIAVEDAHWLDSASIALLTRAARVVPKLLIVLTARAPEPGQVPLYQPILEARRNQRIGLGPLSTDEVSELVCKRFQIQDLPETVVALIEKRALGNPFFSLELVRALRDFGILSIAGDRCTTNALDPEKQFEEALIARGLPGTLQGVLMSRIDRLTPHQKLVLKCASVIGQPFPARLLRALMPFQGGELDLERILDDLITLDLVRLAANDPEPRFVLVHGLAQDAVYATISFAQRQELHRTVAEWYEGAEGAAQVRPLLAHHYRRAEIKGRALDYYEAAGSDALRLFANAEAVKFFSASLEIAEEIRAQTSKHEPGRDARNELALGRAYVGWSKHAEGCQHLERGLRLLGRRIPTSTLGMVLAIVFELFRQVLHRLLPRFYVGRSTQQRTGLLLGARAFEGLTEAYFNNGQNGLCLFAAIASLNMAERAGPSPELARGYASMGAIMGFIPAPAAARAYSRRADEAARRAGDSPAQAWAAIARGVFEAGVGNFDHAIRLFRDASTMALEVGEVRRCDDSSENEAAIAYLRGDLRLSSDVAERLHASARLRSDLSMQASAIRQKTQCLLVEGRLREADSCVVELRQLGRRERGKPGFFSVVIPPLAALIHMRRADYDEAARQALDGAHQIAKFGPMYYPTVVEHSALAEVLLELRELGRLENPAASRAACKRLRAFARVFPVARPAALIWTGLERWLSGRKPQAMSAWNEAVSVATELGVPYFAALARYQIGRHLPRGDVDRVEQLARAIETLDTLGERHYSVAVRNLTSAIEAPTNA
jgi:class 3 adenylate cyclase